MRRTSISLLLSNKGAGVALLSLLVEEFSMAGISCGDSIICV